MTTASARWIIVVGLTTFTIVTPPSFLLAQETTSTAQHATDEEAMVTEESILDELAKGIKLLDEQITKQQHQLKAATTDREREIIRDHLRFLRDERRALTRLAHQLAGPEFDARAAAQEQQAEQTYERQEKKLEERIRP